MPYFFVVLSSDNDWSVLHHFWNDPGQTKHKQSVHKKEIPNCRSGRLVTVNRRSGLQDRPKKREIDITPGRPALVGRKICYCGFFSCQDCLYCSPLTALRSFVVDGLLCVLVRVLRIFAYVWYARAFFSLRSSVLVLFCRSCFATQAP